jgi:hypothetical protein
MTPRMEALAYFIRAYATPLGWDVTATDVAKAVGTTPQAVGIICKDKGWGNRLRRDSPVSGSSIDFTTRLGMTGDVEQFVDRVAAPRTNCARLAEEPSE